jgi:hypothetical protein
MNFEKANDTIVLENVLTDAAVGDLITYDQMSSAIGRDVREHALPSLRSARRALIKSKGVVFGVEHGVGYRRLNDVEIVESSVSDRNRIRRAANRSLNKLKVVKFDGLDETGKRNHIAASAQLGAVAMFASNAACKKIESKVETSKSVIAIGETLKMFS